MAVLFQVSWKNQAESCFVVAEAVLLCFEG